MAGDSSAQSTGTTSQVERATPAHTRPLLRLLGLSRLVILIAVLGTFITATILLIYGGVDTYQLVRQYLAGGDTALPSKKLIIAAIELTDIFLLATVLYVIAVGLYELFIDDRIPVPRWLRINDIDDLKHKLVGVVIAVLGVTFLGQVLSWDGTRDLQTFGIAIGAVVAALTYFLNSKGEKGKGTGKDA